MKCSGVRQTVADSGRGIEFNTQNLLECFEVFKNWVISNKQSRNNRKVTHFFSNDAVNKTELICSVKCLAEL